MLYFKACDDAMAPEVVFPMPSLAESSEVQPTNQPESDDNRAIGHGLKQAERK